MKRTKKLQGGKEVPVVTPLPPGYPDLDPNPTIAVCGECGLELKHVMGYVCSNSRCPCGLGPIIC